MPIPSRLHQAASTEESCSELRSFFSTFLPMILITLQIQEPGSDAWVAQKSDPTSVNVNVEPQSNRKGKNKKAQTPVSPVSPNACKYILYYFLLLSYSFHREPTNLIPTTIVVYAIFFQCGSQSPHCYHYSATAGPTGPWPSYPGIRCK